MCIDWYPTTLLLTLTLGLANYCMCILGGILLTTSSLPQARQSCDHGTPPPQESPLHERDNGNSAIQVVKEKNIITVHVTTVCVHTYTHYYFCTTPAPVHWYTHVQLFTTPIPDCTLHTAITHIITVLEQWSLMWIPMAFSTWDSTAPPFHYLWPCV